MATPTSHHDDASSSSSPPRESPAILRVAAVATSRSSIVCRFLTLRELIAFHAAHRLLGAVTESPLAWDEPSDIQPLETPSSEGDGMYYRPRVRCTRIDHLAMLARSSLLRHAQWIEIDLARSITIDDIPPCLLAESAESAHLPRLRGLLVTNTSGPSFLEAMATAFDGTTTKLPRFWSEVHTLLIGDVQPRMLRPLLSSVGWLPSSLRTLQVDLSRYTSEANERMNLHLRECGLGDLLAKAAPKLERFILSHPDYPRANQSPNNLSRSHKQGGEPNPNRLLFTLTSLEAFRGLHTAHVRVDLQVLVQPCCFEPEDANELDADEDASTTSESIPSVRHVLLPWTPSISFAWGDCPYTRDHLLSRLFRVCPRLRWLDLAHLDDLQFPRPRLGPPAYSRTHAPSGHASLTYLRMPAKHTIADASALSSSSATSLPVFASLFPRLESIACVGQVHSWMVDALFQRLCDGMGHLVEVDLGRVTLGLTSIEPLRTMATRLTGLRRIKNFYWSGLMAGDRIIDKRPHSSASSPSFWPSSFGAWLARLEKFNILQNSEESSLLNNAPSFAPPFALARYIRTRTVQSSSASFNSSGEA